jgi:soluble lytic murein transglycosylase-like protein
MNNTTQNTLTFPSWPAPLRVFVQDLLSGMLVISRFVVTLAGAFSLVAGALILGDHESRAVVAQRVSDFSSALFARAEVIAEPVITEAKAEGLETTGVRQPEPAQRHVVQYLSKRYRVADGAMRPIVAEAYSSGREHSLDPLLILAVMAVESSMNPFAESNVGAQGLMQVMTRVHAEKFEEHGGENAALDPIANVKVGSFILKDLIRRGGSVERGLQLYVGAGNLPDDRGYAARVLLELSRLRIAATGKVENALAAGMRTAQQEQPAITPAKPAATEAKSGSSV